MEQESRGRTSRRRRSRDGGDTPQRQTNYRQLRNPFPQMPVFSDDQIAAMHDTALQMLEELGIKVLLPEARKIFANAGARVDESTQMVYLGRDIIAEALSTAPRSITARAATRERDLLLELGSLTFQCGAGAVDLQPGWRRFDRRLASSARVRIPRLASTTRAPACVRNPLCSTRSLPRNVENPTKMRPLRCPAVWCRARFGLPTQFFTFF